MFISLSLYSQESEIFNYCSGPIEPFPDRNADVYVNGHDDLRCFFKQETKLKTSRKASNTVVATILVCESGEHYISDIQSTSDNSTYTEEVKRLVSLPELQYTVGIKDGKKVSTLVVIPFHFN